MESSSSEEEFQTPKKRRYKSSIFHGFSKRNAKYHKITPDKPNNYKTGKPNTSTATGNRNHVSSTRLFTQTDIETSTLSSDSDLNLSDESTSDENDDQDMDINDQQLQNDISLTEIDTNGSSVSSEQNSSSLTTSSDEEYSSLSATDVSDSQNTSESDDYVFENSDSNSDGGQSEVENSLRNKMDKPLYDGCKFSQYKAYVLIMLYVTKNSLSKEGFDELLQLLSALMPSNCKLPKSVYNLKETLKKCLNYKEPKQHFYCENCQNSLPDKNACDRETCLRNRAKTLEFYDLGMADQLKRFFQDDNFVNAVKKQNKKAEEAGSDLTDVVQGQYYQKMLPKHNGADMNLTLTLNTDGVSIFKSSKKGSLWPVYLAVNELPVKLRFSRKYLIPCFLHCHSEKPNMITYLSPLMKTLNSLNDKGITVQTEEGTLLVKAQLLMASLDLPARAIVANMKQFNGKFGCSVCFDEGKGRPGQAMLRYFPYKELVQLRTHTSMVTDARKAVLEGNEVHGIKGASPLMMLPYLDMPKSLVIDWMHCVLLGVTKALMTLWFNSKNKEKNYFIGDKIELLDRRLLGIKIPDFFSRRQRTLHDHTHWKASEMREWLLHFSVPVLENLLAPEPYLHYMLLVSGISTLVRDDLKKIDVDYAESCLIDFCKIYPKIYGDFSQTMNLHLVRHLPTYVRMYGPLYGYSCFGFESMNSFLKRMIHGTSHINKQISFAICMTKELTSAVKTFIDEEEKTSMQLFKKLSARFIQDDKTAKEILSLGKKTNLPTQSPHYLLLSREMRDNGVKVFSRLQFRGTVFYSKGYQDAKTRNDSACCFSHNNVTKKGIILLFLEYENQINVIIQECFSVPFNLGEDIRRQINNCTLKDYLDKTICRHIEKIEGFGENIVISANKLLKKCVLMEIYNSESFFSIPPNTSEHN